MTTFLNSLVTYFLYRIPSADLVNKITVKLMFAKIFILHIIHVTSSKSNHFSTFCKNSNPIFYKIKSKGLKTDRNDISSKYLFLIHIM